MKKRFLTTVLAVVLLALSVAALPSCSTRNTAKFTFELKDARLEYSEVVGIYYAAVTVVTTCVSGRLYVKEYPHNAEGGKPWILDDDVAREGRAEVNALVTKLDIRKGDVIEYTWTFDIPADFIEGDYAVRVEWFGSEQTFDGIAFLKTK